ncbi:MAG: recombinase family protein [Candidatus Caldatribacteriota bacterium]
MKAAIYARVSSEKQAEKELSIASQLKALLEYARKNNYDIYDEFIDEAESARTANRPAFQRMIALAKQKDKPFDTILVWKYSRFARSRNDSIVFKTLLKKKGVSVISINEKIDDSPMGYILEGMIELIDEFYSINLSQDTIRGLRENASRGFNNGTPPYGYQLKKVKEGSAERSKLEINESQAPLIKSIFTMYLEGKGIKEIAKTLNSQGHKTNKGKAWYNSSISYILKNEVYTGTLLYGKRSRNSRFNKKNDVIRVEDNHPAIIDKETFTKVQDLTRIRRPEIQHPREVNSKYLLSGLLYCGKCNHKMVGASAKSGRNFYYACSNYYKRGKQACDAKMINKDMLEKTIMNRIKKHIITEKNLRELLLIINEEMEQDKKELEIQLKTIQKNLEILKSKRDKLYNAIEGEMLELKDIAPRLKDLNQQISTQERNLRQISEKIQSPSKIDFGLDKLKTYTNDLKELLNEGTFVEQKSFIQSFVKKIIVNQSKIKIEYNLPIISKIDRTSTKEVLSMVQSGSPAPSPEP